MAIRKAKNRSLKCSGELALPGSLLQSPLDRRNLDREENVLHLLSLITRYLTPKPSAGAAQWSADCPVLVLDSFKVCRNCECVEQCVCVCS